MFDDAEMPRIDITISQSNLQELYAAPESNVEYYAIFSFTRGDSVEGPLEIGLRFRGDSIRLNEKKSFRISFNSIDAGADYHGLEKMNLNAEANDPSLVRSRLGHSLYRYLGVACPAKQSCASLHQRPYYGVYLNTEHVDERFIKSRFDNNDGNLYMCQYNADLAYLGPDFDYSSMEVGGDQIYEFRTNEKWDDYGDLEQLDLHLESAYRRSLKNELERILNVQQFLKVMALEVLCGNWDGYIGKGNNYYLYRDQSTGRFEYIPYILENSQESTFWEWTGQLARLQLEQEFKSPLYGHYEIDELKQQYTHYVKCTCQLHEFCSELFRRNRPLETTDQCPCGRRYLLLQGLGLYFSRF